MSRLTGASDRAVPSPGQAGGPGVATGGAGEPGGTVFGGSSGIGAAVVRVMAGRGHRVLAASRRAIAPEGTGAVAARCDVRDSAGVAALLAQASRTGLAEWVVNAAGVGFYAPFESRFVAQWREILDTNVVGMLNVLAALRDLRVPVRHFVQIGSLAGTRPSRTPGNDVYSAAKAAVNQLLTRYRGELRMAGSTTRITLVTPGYVGGTDFSRRYFDHVPELSKPILDRFTPLSPADVADVVEYSLTAPEHVELSEIVIRPIGQPD